MLSKKLISSRIILNAGFTLIEVLVSIGIIGVLLGLTIPSYTAFKTNQELTQAAQTLKSNLRFAQSQALAGVKPSDCTTDTTMTLVGWYLHLGSGARNYQTY